MRIRGRHGEEELHFPAIDSGDTHSFIPRKRRKGKQPSEHRIGQPPVGPVHQKSPFKPHIILPDQHTAGNLDRPTRSSVKAGREKVRAPIDHRPGDDPLDIKAAYRMQKVAYCCVIQLLTVN